MPKFVADRRAGRNPHRAPQVGDDTGKFGENLALFAVFASDG